MGVATYARSAEFGHRFATWEGVRKELVRPGQIRFRDCTADLGWYGGLENMDMESCYYESERQRHNTQSEHDIPFTSNHPVEFQSLGCFIDHVVMDNENLKMVEMALIGVALCKIKLLLQQRVIRIPACGSLRQQSPKLRSRSLSMLSKTGYLS